MKRAMMRCYTRLVPQHENEMDQLAAFLFFLSIPILFVFGLIFAVYDVHSLISPPESDKDFVPFAVTVGAWGVAGFVLYMLRQDYKHTQKRGS